MLQFLLNDFIPNLNLPSLRKRCGLWSMCLTSILLDGYYMFSYESRPVAFGERLNFILESGEEYDVMSRMLVKKSETSTFWIESFM